MNKLLFSLIFLSLIKLIFTINICDTYLVSSTVGVGITTWVIDFVNRELECEIPIILFDGVATTTTFETLTQHGKYIRKLKKEKTPYHMYRSDIDVSLGLPYCDRDYLTGNDVDRPIGQGTGTSTPFVLKEVYTKTDLMGRTELSFREINTSVITTIDESFQFELVDDNIFSNTATRAFINFIESDKQTTEFLEIGTTYQIGGVVAPSPQGTFTINSVITGNELNILVPIFNENSPCINYNFVNGTFERCWQGCIDISFWNTANNVYANCTDGSLKYNRGILPTEFNDIDVDICRQLKNTGTSVEKDSVRFRITFVIDTAPTAYTFPTTYYEAVKTFAPKISIEVTPLNGYTRLKYIMPDDDTKEIGCNFGSSQLSHPDIFIDTLNSYALVYDRPFIMMTSPSTFEIDCDTTVPTKIVKTYTFPFIEDPISPNDNFEHAEFAVNIFNFYTLGGIIYALWFLLWLLILWLILMLILCFCYGSPICCSYKGCPCGCCSFCRGKCKVWFDDYNESVNKEDVPYYNSQMRGYSTTGGDMDIEMKKLKEENERLRTGKKSNLY